MTKQDIDKAFFEAIEDKDIQSKAGIETRQLYEMRSERRYTTIAARLEILYKAGLLELKKK